MTTVGLIASTGNYLIKDLYFFKISLITKNIFALRKLIDSADRNKQNVEANQL